jgi:DNA adenine methylase
MIGWIGFMGSFNGRFYDGGYSGKTTTRDYVSEQIRNTEKQKELLDGAIFINGDYDTISYPINSIIYPSAENPAIAAKRLCTLGRG